MLQTYNEERSIGACVEHLHAHGVDVYLLDDGSTDATVEVAERYLGRGIIEIEELPSADAFRLREQCRRQEVLADTLDADWLIHYDADEIRVSPQGAPVAGAGARRARRGRLQRRQLPRVHVRADARVAGPRPPRLPANDALLLPVPPVLSGAPERLETAGRSGRASVVRGPQGSVAGWLRGTSASVRRWLGSAPRAGRRTPGKAVRSGPSQGAVSTCR